MLDKSSVTSLCRTALRASNHRLLHRRSFASTSRLRENYGFIGIGMMGYGMAKNLRQKISPSDTLFIQDVNAAATKRFTDEFGKDYDVQVAETVKEVAEKSSTIITVLPRPEHVKGVFQQLLESSTPRANASPRLFIDCSTIDPMTSASVAATVQRSSSQDTFIDAPMSGGVVGASAGKLTFMFGAEPRDVSRVTAVLSLMGARAVHMGPQTSGLKAKLANNYLLALNNIATAEAMNMGVRWGLDPKVLANMINSATGKCWPSEVNNPVPGVVETAPASRDYVGGFGAGLMLKDLNLALQAAEEVQVKPQLGLQAKEIYEAVEADEKLRGKDFSVVYRYFGGDEGGKN